MGVALLEVAIMVANVSTIDAIVMAAQGHQRQRMMYKTDKRRSATNQYQLNKMIQYVKFSSLNK